VSVRLRASARPRRRYPRLTLRVDVVLETDAGRVAATATTLGAGGLFVATSAPLEASAPLLVRFRLPGDDTELCLRGHVAWNRRAENGSAGSGVSFDDADARSDLAARLERWADLRETPRSGADGGVP
jgi:Tfp pilus assembly protein PilZ